MPTTLTSREFNQDTGRAKRVAEESVVYITDRGTPTHVLMSIKDYQRLVGTKKSLLDVVCMADGEDIDLPLDIRRDLPREVDLD